MFPPFYYIARPIASPWRFAIAGNKLFRTTAPSYYYAAPVPRRKSETTFPSMKSERNGIWVECFFIPFETKFVRRSVVFFLFFFFSFVADEDKKTATRVIEEKEKRRRGHLRTIVTSVRPSLSIREEERKKEKKNRLVI